MTTWWQTEQWHAYERAYGDEPGTRERLLAHATWMTQVVDLRLPKADLWRDVRKSYKSLIHRAEEHHSIFGWADGTANNSGWMREFKALHAACAGRQTRGDETWRLMAEWLDTGNAMLFGAMDAGCVSSAAPSWRAFAYFFVHGRWAYYASAASLDDNVNHALVWTAMNALHCRGVEILELGWQDQATDAKGRAIEFFRRGFGGRAIPPWEAAQCA